MTLRFSLQMRGRPGRPSRTSGSSRQTLYIAMNILQGTHREGYNSLWWAQRGSECVMYEIKGDFEHLYSVVRIGCKTCPSLPDT